MPYSNDGQALTALTQYIVYIHFICMMYESSSLFSTVSNR